MTIFEMNGFGCGYGVGTLRGDGGGAASNPLGCSVGFGDGDYVGGGYGHCIPDGCHCYDFYGDGCGMGAHDTLVYYGGVA